MSVASPVIGSLDTTNKLIHLDTGIREYHPIDDIYKEIRNMRRLDEDLRKFDMMISAEGAVPKGGGKFTPRYAVFQNGWRVVPEDTTHDLYISGEQITDDGQSGKACMDLSVLSPGTNVFVHYEPPAAELIKAEAELQAIKRMAFDGRVTISESRGSAGTEWPLGTSFDPSDNLVDTLTILHNEGLYTIHAEEDITIDNGQDYTGLHFIGASKTKTIFTISEAAQVDRTEFYESEVTGTLDGDTTLIDCLIANLNYVTGFIERCVLAPGIIRLGGGTEAHFLDCYSGVPGVGTPTIDMGGSGAALAMRNYAGGIRLMNKSGPESVSIDLASGQVRLTDTVTHGTIVVRGDGKLVDDQTDQPIPTGTYNNGNLIILNELNNPDLISEAVWANSVATTLVNNVQNVTDIEMGKWEIVNNQMIFYAPDNTTEIMRFDLFNKQGTATDDYVYSRVRV